jgi:outer membrane protein OmpA-like peptidoglycan-associated protein
MNYPDTEPQRMNTRRTRGRPGPALTIGLPVIAAVALGYWGFPKVAPWFGLTKVQAVQSATNQTQQQQPHGPLTFKVAADPWSGYSTFRNEPRFASALAKHRITLNYLDEEKYYDQGERMRALAAGEIDFALTTLDAFLQHGAAHTKDEKYPGVILFGIDESAGGDAIFLSKGQKSFDEVKPTDKVCFSVGTPSEHLWDFASLAFSNLGDSLQQDNGVVAKDCWLKLAEGKVQVAVLWQPYTAIAQKAGYAKVFATGGQADDVILDIFVANRAVLQNNKTALQEMASAYFQTIDSYQRDKAQHAEFVRADCGADCVGDSSLGESVIDGIDFLTFEENLCLWFGQCGAPNKLAPRLGKTARLLIAKGKLKAEAVPEPASVIDDSLLLAIKKERIEAARLAAEVSGPETIVELPTFSAQDPTYSYTVAGAEGAAANVGTLKLPNVFFRDGAYGLDPEAKTTVASIADQLRSFPALCVRIAGYTSSSGNPRANRQLSRFRAMAIAAELGQLDARAFPASRFEIVGMGSAAPVVSGNTEDAKASRRTEFTLFRCTGKS